MAYPACFSGFGLVERDPFCTLLFGCFDRITSNPSPFLPLAWSLFAPLHPLEWPPGRVCLTQGHHIRRASMTYHSHIHRGPIAMLPPLSSAPRGPPMRRPGAAAAVGKAFALAALLALFGLLGRRIKNQWNSSEIFDADFKKQRPWCFFERKQKHTFPSYFFCHNGHT